MLKRYCRVSAVLAVLSCVLLSGRRSASKTAPLHCRLGTTARENRRFLTSCGTPPTRRARSSCRAEQRIATFDQDGTLWVEHPMYTQVMFCLERVPAVVAESRN